MNVLEGLYAARAGIDPQSFEFNDYRKCTCGHIYRGAEGEPASDSDLVTARPEGLYEAMLRAVVEANGLPSPFGNDADLARRVSYGTSLRAHAQQKGNHREAAVLLLSTAIEKLEGEQQAALGAVKARDQGPVVGGVGR